MAQENPIVPKCARKTILLTKYMSAPCTHNQWLNNSIFCNPTRLVNVVLVNGIGVKTASRFDV